MLTTSARLGLYYAALFIGSGASSPNAGLWFKSHGLSGAAIGLILAAPAMGRALSGPLVAHWADGFRLRRTPLALLGLGVAGCYLGLAIAHGFWAWAVLWFAAGSLFANLSPLADVIALRRARAEGFSYGGPRGVGSAAFVIANVGMGLVLTWAPASALLVWITIAALAVAAAAQWLLPNEPVHAAGETLPHADRWRGVGALLRDPVFMLAVVSVGLIQASHGFYYGFSVLAWRAQGLSASITGLLWGVGVTAEVLFFWLLEPWRRRVGPERLVLWGGTAAVVRWVCLACAPPLWVLVLVQTLHALTYTATFVGSLQLAERLAPEASASAAQTLNSVLSGGFLIGLSTMAAGRLFDVAGVTGYVAMSGIALLGLAGAACLAPLQRARRSAASLERA